MLEKEVEEEIQELMSAMKLPYVAVSSGTDKKYYSLGRVSDIPFEEKYQLLDDMKGTYEILNKTPWFSERSE